VEVYGRDQPELLGRGVLVLVDNQIDAASGTLRLKARLDNPDHTLWPGQTVDVRLILGDRAGALVVPESAVQRGAQGLYVYLVGSDDRVSAQTVQVAVAQDGLAVVTEGLSAGQRVVVDGQDKLRPGLKIAEIAANAADAPAAGGQSISGKPGDASISGPSASAAVPSAPRCRRWPCSCRAWRCCGSCLWRRFPSALFPPTRSRPGCAAAIRRPWTPAWPSRWNGN